MRALPGNFPSHWPLPTVPRYIRTCLNLCAPVSQQTTGKIKVPNPEGCWEDQEKQIYANQNCSAQRKHSKCLYYCHHYEYCHFPPERYVQRGQVLCPKPHDGGILRRPVSPQSSCSHEERGEPQRRSLCRACGLASEQPAAKPAPPASSGGREAGGPGQFSWFASWQNSAPAKQCP